MTPSMHSRPAGEGEREAVAILKGIGKITGDGWKDTTIKGEIVYVWNAEKPSPYAPGQYPRIGNEGWSASTSQYDFTPATADDVPAILSLLRPAAPDAGGGWMPIETAPKDGTEILVAPHMTVVAWDFGAEQWVVGIIPLNRDRTIADDWTVQPAMMFEQYLSNWGVEPTHWMPLPAPPALQPGGER